MKKEFLIRFKRASLPEIFYRAKHRFENRGLRRRILNGRLFLSIPRIEHDDWADLVMPEFQWNGKVNSLKGKPFLLNSAEDKIKAVETKWKHVLSYDVRSDECDQDIRSIWEPARLQQLTQLLIIAIKSQTEDASRLNEEVRAGILEWIEQNPFLFGPHYLSPMECGLRIPIFAYALITQAHWSDKDCDHILCAIYEHGWWIAQRLSLYSSLGNHTICESVGLIFAGAIYRKNKNGKKWLEKGVSLLKQELSHQIMEDGGPSEHSMNYHRFVLDLYWLAIDFLEENGLFKCSAWKPRLTEGEKFLETFTDSIGNVPSIGDSDDGYAVAPGIYPKRAVGDFAELRPCMTFSKSGYTVIRGMNGLLFTFDHGPLGMTPLYNHGHADALSITLSLAGEQIFVDPGTYRYNGEPEWRHYFKGTRAHNTVNIDGFDQAVQETGFIWSHPYKAELLRTTENDDSLLLEATHDGYARFKYPVHHKRTIAFFNKQAFVIRDTFSGKGNHDFELNFHLHPDAFIQQENDSFIIQKGRAQINITLSAGDSFKVKNGESSPCFGWYSPSYGIKRESSVLTCTKTGKPNEVSFVTIIFTSTEQLEINQLIEMALLL